MNSELYYIVQRKTFQSLCDYLADSNNYNKFENWNQTNLWEQFFHRNFSESEIIDLLDLLYKQGFNMNLKFHRPTTGEQFPILNVAMSLTKFSLKFRERLVHQIVDFGVNVNDTDSRGETPLICCAFELKGFSASLVMHLLLTHGADPNVVDNKGKSALRVTILHDNPVACRVLLERGVDEESKNEFRKNSIRDEMIMLSNDGLINGENIIPIWAKYSKIGLASCFEFTQNLYLDNAVFRYNSKMVRILLPLVSDINAVDGNDRTALMVLLHEKIFRPVLHENKKKHDQFIENLKDLILLALEVGADVKKKDNNGFTILFLAVMNNMPEVVHAILSRYVGNINYISNFEDTPQYNVTALEYNLRECFKETDNTQKDKRRHISGMLWHYGAFLNLNIFTSPTTAGNFICMTDEDRQLLIHMLNARERWMHEYYTKAKESVRIPKAPQDDLFRVEALGIKELRQMIKDFI